MEPLVEAWVALPPLVQLVTIPFFAIACMLCLYVYRRIITSTSKCDTKEFRCGGHESMNEKVTETHTLVQALVSNINNQFEQINHRFDSMERALTEVFERLLHLERGSNERERSSGN